MAVAYLGLDKAGDRPCERADQDGPAGRRLLRHGRPGGDPWRARSPRITAISPPPSTSPSGGRSASPPGRPALALAAGRPGAAAKDAPAERAGRGERGGRSIGTRRGGPPVGNRVTHGAPTVRPGLSTTPPTRAVSPCRLRHRPGTDPVTYAIDIVYWCRWRRRQILGGRGGRGRARVEGGGGGGGGLEAVAVDGHGAYRADGGQRHRVRRGVRVAGGQGEARRGRVADEERRDSEAEFVGEILGQGVAQDPGSRLRRGESLPIVPMKILRARRPGMRSAPASMTTAFPEATWAAATAAAAQ